MIDDEKKFNLEAMLAYQKAFQDRELRRLFPEGVSTEALHHSLCSHLIAEGQELMDCQPWMLHKKPPAFSKYTTTTEMVDVFKWLLNIMLLHGVTPSEFGAVFQQKSAVVEDRIRTEVFVRSKPGPVLICDLDGVLVNRDRPLLAFINGRENAHWTSLDEARKHMNSVREYEKHKYAFYDSDSFYHCPPYEDAIRFIQTFKKDTPMVILTARDVKRHAGIHYHTIEWLKKHEVPYDALIFFEEKDKALGFWADERCIAIDDEEKQVERMSRVCNAWQYNNKSPVSQQLFAEAFEQLQKIRK